MQSNSVVTKLLYGPDLLEVSKESLFTRGGSGGTTEGSSSDCGQIILFHY